eukprot:5638236-Prymnesium_polylepis.1
MGNQQSMAAERQVEPAATAATAQRRQPTHQREGAAGKRCGKGQREATHQRESVQGSGSCWGALGRRSLWGGARAARRHGGPGGQIFLRGAQGVRGFGLGGSVTWRWRCRERRACSPAARCEQPQ